MVKLLEGGEGSCGKGNRPWASSCCREGWAVSRTSYAEVEDAPESTEENDDERDSAALDSLKSLRDPNIGKDE